MTKEETKERAEVMLEWVNGEEVEYWDRAKSIWIFTNEPLWEPDTKYRIKKEEQPILSFSQAVDMVFEMVSLSVGKEAVRSSVVAFCKSHGIEVVK